MASIALTALLVIGPSRGQVSSPDCRYCREGVGDQVILVLAIKERLVRDVVQERQRRLDAPANRVPNCVSSLPGLPPVMNSRAVFGIFHRPGRKTGSCGPTEYPATPATAASSQ